MELHLFSTPGPGSEITWVLDACGEILGNRSDATVACLPQGSSTSERGRQETERAFRDMAQIESIDTEAMQTADMEGVLRRAVLAYIPGGNAFLLNHRLQVSRLAPFLRKKVQNGLPVVAFGAGTVVCGPKILTSNDLNLMPSSHFDGLG